MKITRYPQSCLLVEQDGTRILIDPGLDFAEAFTVGELGKLDAVIYTHEHYDHFHEETYQEFIRNNIPCFSNRSVKSLAPEVIVKDDGESFEVGAIKVSAHDLPHCLMPDGSEGPQNTGFLLNDRLFHPGDGVNLEGISAEIVALPITGPDISLKDAFMFTRQLSAKFAIPIHYDRIGTRPDVFAVFVKRFDPDLAILPLAVGENIEL